MRTEWAKSARRAAGIALIAVVVAIAGCETMRVGSDYDHRANFSAYHRFAWLTLEDPRARVMNPLVPRRVREAVDQALARKGYERVDDPAAADFVVDFTIGSRERIDVQSYPVPYRGPWGWGYPYFGREVSVRRYRDGTLAIDVFDARTRQPVWHGWAKKELTRADFENPGEPIREAVDAVLASFPPH